MSDTNPKAIPRNHEVETFITSAESGQQDIQQQIDDYLNYLRSGVATNTSWGHPNAGFDQHYQTFCGT
jgi:hypothetical protein